MPIDMNQYRDFTIGGLVERWEGESVLRDQIAQQRGALQEKYDALHEKYRERGKRIEELETTVRVLTGILKPTEAQWQGEVSE